MKEIKIKLLGKEFIFNIQDNINSDDFNEIIAFVDNKMKQIRAAVGELDSFRLGLLTSINIAEEFFSLKKENEKLKEILNKIDHMISPEDGEKKISIRFSS